ncbi:MAG: lipoprotein NlpD/LppB [marine bacterium B5-7]|nr:MAG: lipoprotein NlpD/LppB [marine bacterium B5-7]
MTFCEVRRPESTLVHVLVITIVVILINGCAPRVSAPVRDLSAPLKAVEVYRIVRPGDTLYSLSWAAGVDYRQLAAWNGLSPPYIIKPGQRVSLIPTGRKPVAGQPSVAASTSRTSPKISALPSTTAAVATPIEPTAIESPDVVPAAPSVVTAAKPQPSTVPSQAGASVPVSPANAVALNNRGTWQWPLKGKVVGDFKATRGVDIATTQGTPVHASAPGRVVYAGSGLRGYGQLVIVKHSDEYLSAYGHNRKLLVEEGDVIVGGQVIAESGSAPGEGDQIHFEIRRNGQPVDPMQLLVRS